MVTSSQINNLCLRTASRVSPGAISHPDSGSAAGAGAPGPGSPVCPIGHTQAELEAGLAALRSPPEPGKR